MNIHANWIKIKITGNVYNEYSYNEFTAQISIYFIPNKNLNRCSCKTYFLNFL